MVDIIGACSWTMKDSLNRSSDHESARDLFRGINGSLLKIRVAGVAPVIWHSLFFHVPLPHAEGIKKKI